ncbi:MAG: thioesterase, partial [Rubrivivax sp.]
MQVASALTRIVDAHHHLWDLGANRYPWLTDRVGPRMYGDYADIRRDYLVVDYKRDIGALPVLKTVHV